MRKFAITIMAMAMLSWVAGCTSVRTKATDKQMEKKIDELLAKMTLEEKVGQMTQVTLEVVAGETGKDGSLKLDKKKLAIGEQVEFTFTVHVRTRETCKIRFEYILYFAKAHGKVFKKVFKISEGSLKPGEHVVTKRHSFANMSTRTHYPGKHQIAIIINGVEKVRSELMLTK